MSDNLQLAIAYSLSRVIEDNLGVPAVIGYDGINLPSDKPFAVIWQMNNVVTSVAKARESVAINYGFRASFHCESLAQRTSLQESFRDILLFEELPLYDSQGVLTSRTFEVVIDGEVPLGARDISDETNQHQVHFELSITKIKHKNRGK